MTDSPLSTPASPPPGRGVFGNRTLNLRSVRAIGYDMDYTLIHYRSEKWEERAYEHTREKLAALGWPVEGLEFDAEAVTRGLTLDLELGNLVKANRFGYVIKAAHGTRTLDFDEQRRTYSRVPVDLADPRFRFLNTLFSFSEACLFAQLVDLLDEGRLPKGLGYDEVHEAIRENLDEAHIEGRLKAEIVADPELYVVLDEETPLALLDQRHAGKKLLLITNSEWDYTRAMMSWAFDRFLPGELTWRDLFDTIIVSARKPGFFSDRNPIYEVVDEERSLLAPHVRRLDDRGVFFGGNARLVEDHLGLDGDEILYVGDHLFGDVHVSKAVLRWRTALILRELEDEVRGLHEFGAAQAALSARMGEKEEAEAELCRLRLGQQRRRRGYGPEAQGGPSAAELDRYNSELRARIAGLDEAITPLAVASGRIGNPHWGQLMRAGNDKSLFARQVERYADIYTSRVSNFLYQTPFVYLRAPRGSLPHDPPFASPEAMAGDDPRR